MKVKDILDELVLTGSYNTNRMIYENALYYYGSILLNANNIRLNGKNIRYFGTTLASSAAGKDWANNKVIDILFQGKDNTYATAMRQEADKFWEKQYPFALALPQNMTVSLEGTKEGLFKVAQAQANSNFGSLNLLANEMGRVVSSSSDLIEKTKELYDGKYIAKTIKGSDEREAECNIENIICNMLMFGSPAGMNKESKDLASELFASGLYRRTYIINIEPSERHLKEDVTPNMSISWFSNYKPSIADLKIDDEAKLYIQDIKLELLEKSNENLYDTFAQADSAAIGIIVDLASIICFLQKEYEINIEHIQDAYSFFNRSRSTIADIFKKSTVHDSIYSILKRTKQCTRHELVSIDPNLDVGKKQWEDAIDILQEMCYIRNEYLNIVGSKVVKYSIEELPINKLDKIKISVSKNNQPSAINFKQYEVPFFGDGVSIESLLVSEYGSFATCHFKPSIKATDGHRKAENFISGQNLIAFDIDDGLLLKDALEMLEPYTYIIYTTKSHNIKGDRFRILMPTKTEFFVDDEQHKEMYENLSIRLDIRSYDIATRNVSRLWFINKECELYKNKGELLDVECCLPSTDKSNAIMPSLLQVDEMDIDRRITGIYKWFLSNTSEGSRNFNLFKIGKFIKDLEEDYAYHIEYINNMLSDPLSNREINTIIRSVGSK